jgi:hypothetical protein
MALLNTAWYSVMFLSAWTASSAAATRGVGVAAALKSAALTFSFVYGASTLTKVPRSLAILAAVPAVERGLALATRRRGGGAAAAAALAGRVAGACLVAVVALVVGCALAVA